MKKILILFSMLLGFMSSLYAIDDYGREGFFDGNYVPPIHASGSTHVSADMGTYGIKPDNPTSLVASGLEGLKDNLKISGASCTPLKIAKMGIYTFSTFEVGWQSSPNSIKITL